MLTSLTTLDQTLFLALNGVHHPVADQFFYYATKPLVWLPFYLFLLVIVIREFRWRTLLIIPVIALMITVSDQMANLAKQGVERPRPTHNSEIEQVVHTVNGYRGGRFGFWSAHASTNFAIALFLILLLKKHYRWITPVMLLYAFIMSYSRIYLGVHYPGDILAGAGIGLILGCGGGIFMNRLLLIGKKSGN